MKVGEFYSYLNELSPFELQEAWDNSGIIVGNVDDEFERVYISLDLDLDLVSNMEPNSLALTHHPLIFSPLKRVNFDSYSTKILRELIKKNISLISMHTNFDVTHLNKYVATQILGLSLDESKQGYIAYSNVEIGFDKFVEFVKAKLDINFTNCVKCTENIKRVALVTGAGMSMISKVEADCFLTGDIKYHDAMEAKARGISLIDIKHYESESFFSPLMMGLVESYLKKNKLKAIMANSKNPFKH